VTLKVKALIAAVAVTVLVGIGWTARGWLEDSKDLAAMKAQQKLADEIREGQAEISKQVSDRLSELKANERVIDRGVIREIQKPIYKRVCFEPELVELLNAAQRGESVAGSAEPADKVPGDATGIK